MNVKEELKKLKEKLQKKQSIQNEIKPKQIHNLSCDTNKKIQTLDEKLEEFITKYEHRFLFDRQPSDKIEEKIRNFIDKMAVWYELRYPDFSVYPKINKKNNEIFKDNEYIFNSLESPKKLETLDWGEFYNTKAFIQSLSKEERAFLIRPKYPYSCEIYINGEIKHYHLTSKGYVLNQEDSDKIVIQNKKGQTFSFSHIHIKEFLNILKSREFDLSFPDVQAIENMIRDYEYHSMFKEELLDFVMYQIMKRGEDRIGPRRAFLFAKEFHRNIDFPMRYGIDDTDPYLKDFIHEYLKAGGSKDLICYTEYCSSKSLKNMVSLQEVIKNLNSYTSEEKELLQRLVNTLTSKLQKEEVVKQLRIQRNLEKRKK